MAEGLEDLFIGVTGTSDLDDMMEIGGNFRWAPGSVASAEPEVVSPKSAPLLWAKPTSRPGFVTLHWTRTSQCLHESPLPALSADWVRELMETHCLYMWPPGTQITTSGPAVNVRFPGALHGGEDHVPCLRVFWWPAKKEFLHRHQETDFLSKTVRHDICRFGVHLVPTGRPNSRTDKNEWRVSFSRAEVVAIRHLSARQRATIKAVKAMKKCVKDSGEAPTLKSYFVKTAVLWLVQEQPSNRWTGVMEGVKMVLEWLERHIAAGSLPCFLWREVNLLAGLSENDVQDLSKKVRLMKEKAIHLLIDSCEKNDSLDLLLEGGSEPLSERQLRLCLTRMLIRWAVVEGARYRFTAPCWQYFFSYNIPVLARLSEHRLLGCLYHRHSGAHQQQCYLLQALSVAPADLMSRMRLTSLGGDMYTLPVTPLLALLSESDMQFLLGDRAAVAAWCRQQLERPPAERPVGLTAELDTPQGRAEVLLQPELLLRAFRVAVPDKRAAWQIKDKDLAECWRYNFREPPTYQQLRQQLGSMSRTKEMWKWMFIRLPNMDLPMARSLSAFSYLWQRRIRHLLSGDRLRSKHTAVTTKSTDRWQLRQYVMLDSPTEVSQQCGEPGAAGDEQSHSAEQEQQQKEQKDPNQKPQEQAGRYPEEWSSLVRRHQIEWQKLGLQRQQKWGKRMDLQLLKASDEQQRSRVLQSMLEVWGKERTSLERQLQREIEALERRHRRSERTQRHLHT